MSRNTPFYPLGGGMDLTTPAIAMKPGRVIAALNYEPVANGYQRAQGFERHDGQLSPSSSPLVHLLQFFNGAQSPVAGEVLIFGGTTAVFIEEAPGNTGSFVLGTRAGFMRVILTSHGSALPGQAIRRLSDAVLLAIVAANFPATIEAATVSTQSVLRNRIQPVPGSGPVRGVWFYNNQVQAFRDNLGATAANMYRSTATGWSLAPTTSRLPFSYIVGEALLAAGQGVYSEATNATIRGTVRETVLLPGVATGSPSRSPTVSVESGPGDHTILMNAANAPLNVGLPSAVANPGLILVIKKIDATANAVTVSAPSATNTIDGAAQRLLAAQGDGIMVQSNGTIWRELSIGYYIVQSLSGGSFFQGTQIYGTAGGKRGIATAVPGGVAALPPGGRYGFINHNFFGASNLRRMYGVNGVGAAFEYDGSALKAITTGMALDAPTHVAQHKQSLFLAFAGGSVQHSQVGEPFSFDPILGAGEIGVGDEVSDFIPANAGALTILGASSVANLYGNDASDYQLETINAEAGALPYTAQKLGQVLYMDNRGVRSMASSSAYGNFTFGTITQLIQPLLADYKKDGVVPVASTVVRTKSQYLLFFSNGDCICIFMGAKEPSIMPLALGKVVTCIASVEDDGEERIFFGSDDGYVYELNVGTSYDGAPIPYYLRLHFNHFGSPRQSKRLHKVSVELEALSVPTFTVEASFDYGAEAGTLPTTPEFTVGGAAVNDGANERYYSSQIETTADAFLDGVGRNMSIKIAGETESEPPHTLQGITWHISALGAVA